ncbi:MAG: oxygenase MpaB family protein [Stenotrophomonas sp.]|uniref:oxygenase MpaB family protein n=1 Tax=Stenotrophomonas sp. TaxID=69392 RepID=UPI003D6C78A5
MSAKVSKVVTQPNKVVTRERLLGNENRWRRHGEPTPAAADEGVDDGVFGPGSVAWDVLLHPATIVFQTAAQSVLQFTYKPIYAGLRDWDPMSRKGRVGQLTLFDVFDRNQRNSGIHAPMWLGDTDTAKRVALHLARIHEKVAADLIDGGDPTLGGYAANSPRDSMWAALTELHSMLWLYEGLSFRGGWFPRRLPAAKRDQFIAEVAEYCKLFPAREEPLPTNMAELQALYRRDARLFGMPKSMQIIPETGQNYPQVVADSIRKNHHPSQFKVKVQMFLQRVVLRIPVLGVVSRKTHRSMGIGPWKGTALRTARYLLLPMIWFVQQPPVERYFMRMMWGPDAVKLIQLAREKQQAARHSASAAHSKA